MHHAAIMEAGMEKLHCVVCHEEKIESEYYESTWVHRKREHRRCRTCFTCPTCTPGTKHILTDVVHGSKICRTCARTLTCAVCIPVLRKPDTESRMRRDVFCITVVPLASGTRCKLVCHSVCRWPRQAQSRRECVLHQAGIEGKRSMHGTCNAFVLFVASRRDLDTPSSAWLACTLRKAKFARRFCGSADL